jgi:hypothetical protein
VSDQLDAFNMAWFAAMGSRTDRLRVSGMGNVEERERPKRATPLLGDGGTVYDVSSMPILSTEQAQEVGRRALAEGITPTVFRGSAAKDHIVCCDPSTAMCGADQRGEMFGMGAPDPKRMCTACATLSKDPMFKCCATCKGDRS